MKAILALFFLFSLTFAQYNYSGYKDTVAVTGFQSTGTGVTRAFELSQYENACFQAMANDSSAAGYASDSIKFRWGIELGTPVLNASGKKDTTWQERLQIDTFDIRTAANMVIHTYAVDSSGVYNICKGFIDTLYVTGWAVQDRGGFPLSWKPLFRFWYAGMTGNKVGSYVRLVFGQTRRVAAYVKLE